MGQGKRRIDRILADAFVEGLEALDLDEVRARRDECRGELDHLSMLRRYVQVRAEVLKGELERRAGGDTTASLVENLAQIMTQEGQYSRSSTGAAVRLQPPDEEMLLARRRVERLVAEQGLTDPTVLGDEELRAAVEELAAEERSVSTDRSRVNAVLRVLQDELKRRFKDDPTSAIQG